MPHGDKGPDSFVSKGYDRKDAADGDAGVQENSGIVYDESQESQEQAEEEDM